MVDMASSAEENLNVVSETFKSSAADIVAWSKAVGEHVGRSEFTMQEFVGQMGAFLAPKFPIEEAADYSKTLTKLAVDLGSFYTLRTRSPCSASCPVSRVRPRRSVASASTSQTLVCGRTTRRPKRLGRGHTKRSPSQRRHSSESTRS